MADPANVITALVAVGQRAFPIIDTLNEVSLNANGVDQDVRSLALELQGAVSLAESLQPYLERIQCNNSGNSQLGLERVQRSLIRLSSILDHVQALLGECGLHFDYDQSSGPSFSSLRGQFRWYQRKPAFLNFRHRLEDVKSSLDTTLRCFMFHTMSGLDNTSGMPGPGTSYHQQSAPAFQH